MTSLPDDILDLLAAYALGALEPEAIVRVSALLEERPELRVALAELRATADKLPYALPEASPPDDLRQRVLDRATGRAAPATPPAPPRLVNGWRGWALSLGGIAAVAVVAAAIGWGQLLEARSEIAGLQAQITSTQAELKQTHAQVVEAEKVVASLKGASGSAAILQVRGGETVLMAQLPRLAPGRVYQLWRIQGTNAPASAGIFTVDQQGFASALLPVGQQPRSGETVAVTDEPAGGSPGPTSDPLIVGISSNA
jgi:anti-sigma-K factor RskA